MRNFKIVIQIVFVLLIICSGLLKAEPLLIKNVNIIDGTGSPIQTSKDVFIEAGRITRISPTGNDNTSEDLEIVDGSGLFLIPGLWDMHIHWYDERFLSLFIANGVTGVRQMWGMDMHYSWRDRENDLSFIGPKQVIASVIIDGAPKVWPTSIEVTDEDNARQQVQFFHKKGADFIKVYSGLNRDTYFAIADESKKLGIPFAGHVPVAVSIAEASDAGQKSMEHMMQIEQEVIDITFLEKANNILQLTPASRLKRQEELYGNYDDNRKQSLFEKLKINGSWQSPTLTVVRNGVYLRERAGLDKERLTYLPKGITQNWLPENNPRVKNINQEEWTILKHRFAFLQKVVGDMHDSGVKFITGTDVLNPFCFPGFSLHDELELLVESGLSPMAVLQAATFNAAEYSGKLDDLGSVEEGKISDLVLLTENPLEDIRNTKKISAVILNGVLHDRKALDGMLNKMQEQANYGK